jgi:hypothetical protein
VKIGHGAIRSERPLKGSWEADTKARTNFPGKFTFIRTHTLSFGEAGFLMVIRASLLPADEKRFLFLGRRSFRGLAGLSPASISNHDSLKPIHITDTVILSKTCFQGTAPRYGIPLLSLSLTTTLHFENNVFCGWWCD